MILFITRCQHIIVSEQYGSIAGYRRRSRFHCAHLHKTIGRFRIDTVSGANILFVDNFNPKILDTVAAVQKFLQICRPQPKTP